MDIDEIIGKLRLIIRSEGTSQERLKRIWDFIEAAEKRVGKENTAGGESREG